MTDAVSQINESMENAVSAQEAGDYAAAVRYVESAYMRIATLPDSAFEDERLEWDREGILALLKYLQQRSNTTAPMADGSRGAIVRPTDITYTRG